MHSARFRRVTYETVIVISVSGGGGKSVALVFVALAVENVRRQSLQDF